MHFLKTKCAFFLYCRFLLNFVSVQLIDFYTYICIQILTTMKNLILLFSLSLVLFACDKEEVFRLDPLATLSIKPDASGWSMIASTNRVGSAYNHLSALDIVKRTTCMRFKMNNGVEGTRGFDPLQRDTISEIPCLKMWGTDIINTDGVYMPDFIESRNCVLEIWANKYSAWSARDTVGFIPNAVLIAAQDSIQQAYSKQDLQAVYRIFNEAFTFRPCTGSEYRALQALGEN